MGDEKKRRADDTRQVIEAIGRGATSTVRLQGKILRKIFDATIGGIWRRFRRASLLGKLFIVVGLGGAVTLGVLAARDALDVSWTRNDYIRVIARKAKARAGPARGEEVVVRLKRGQRLVQQGEAEGWWFVRAEGWSRAAWISKKSAREEKRILITVDYEMKGYGLAFLGAVLLMFVGFWLKRRKE